MKYASGETPDLGDLVKCVNPPYDDSSMQLGQAGVVVDVYEPMKTVSLKTGEWWNADRFDLLSRHQKQENPMPLITYPEHVGLTFGDLVFGELFSFADADKEQCVRQKCGREGYRNLMLNGDFTVTDNFPVNRERPVYRLTMTTTPQFKASAK